MADPGCRSESSSNLETGLHPPLSDPAKSDKSYNSHKLLCKSPQEPLLVGGIASAYRQKRSRIGAKSKISGVLQPTILSPKTQQQVEAYTRSEQTKSFPQGGNFLNGDTGNHQNIPPARGVRHVNRLQGRLLPHTYTGTVKEISEIPFPGSDIPVQSIAFWSVHSTLGFTVVANEVKMMAIHKGIKIHQYLDNWLVRATSHQVCLQHTQDPVKICQELGWLVNLEKSELEPKQSFDFVGYQFDLRAARIRPTPDRWQNLQAKLQTLLSLLACPV